MIKKFTTVDQFNAVYELMKSDGRDYPTPTDVMRVTTFSECYPAIDLGYTHTCLACARTNPDRFSRTIADARLSVLSRLVCCRVGLVVRSHRFSNPYVE